MIAEKYLAIRDLGFEFRAVLVRSLVERIAIGVINGAGGKRVFAISAGRANPPTVRVDILAPWGERHPSIEQPDVFGDVGASPNFSPAELRLRSRFRSRVGR